MLKANKQIFILIGFFTLIRLVVAPLFGLGVDELKKAVTAQKKLEKKNRESAKDSLHRMPIHITDASLCGPRRLRLHRALDTVIASRQ